MLSLQTRPFHFFFPFLIIFYGNCCCVWELPSLLAVQWLGVWVWGFLGFRGFFFFFFCIISHHRHQGSISEPFYPKQHHSSSYFRLSHPCNLIFTGIQWSLHSPVPLGGAQLPSTSPPNCARINIFEQCKKTPISPPYSSTSKVQRSIKSVKYGKPTPFCSAVGVLPHSLPRSDANLHGGTAPLYFHLQITAHRRASINPKPRINQSWH